MQTSFNLIFDPSEDAAIHWAARTGLEHALDLRTAEQLYTRALPYMKNWAWALAAKHGWTEEAVDTVGDMPLAVCLGRDELVQGTNADQSYVARLVLPANFSDFLNPEFTDDWAAMFSHLMTSHPSDSDSTDIFQLGRAGIPRPLQNILYLLQILSPGLLLVRSMATEEEDDADKGGGEWGPQGICMDLVALPPSIWVGLHIEDLEDIFGAQTAVKLYQAAEDPYCASEDATSYGSYGSQDASEQFSHSSYSTFGSELSEEEWPGMDEPDFEQDDVYLEYSVPYDQSKQDNQPLHLSAFDEHQHEYSHFPDHNLISDVNVGKAANMMEYRHCDSDCAFCGMCSSRFADRLTERLLMHVL
jgi:hypothetical protein